MAVRELVENSLDAAELAGMLPDVYVRIVANDPSPATANQEPKAYRLTVADNGPGVDPHHVPRAFGKVFYGSKYVLRQSRGMFGMGGTMAILYGQITTNKPVKITTSTDGKSRHIFEMLIDISENKPIILRKDTEEGAGKTGTRVDVILEGDFTRSAQKINEYFKQTALVGSYANLTFVDPIGRITTYERATESMPAAPKETLPHPHGIDVESLKRMIKITEEKNMQNFMGNKHFHRVGETNAKKFLQFAGVEAKLAPEKLTNEQIVKVVDALQRYPEFLPPDASCLSPVGEQILTTGIIKELDPEFSTVVLRPPSSYSGFPFLVEVGLVYGGKNLEPGRKLFRFANRIPLLYDESSDVSFKVVNEEIDWRRYHVPEEAPIAVITHICLPHFERILANIDGRLVHRTIGEVIDAEARLSENNETKDGVLYISPRRRITVPSVNPSTLKVEYVPVKRLMRRPGGDILRITTEAGRIVHTSPEHPLLVMSPDGVEAKEAAKLVTGDYLIGARSIPRPALSQTGSASSLDLIDCFVEAGLEQEIVVTGGKQLLYSDSKSKLASSLNVPSHQIDNWRRYDRVPLWAFMKMRPNEQLRSTVKLLGRDSHGDAIPSRIKLDRDLARLMGFYLSEGCSNLKKNNFVSFSFHRYETGYHKEVIDALAHIFGVNPTVEWKKKDKAVQITAYNKALALLFSRSLKAGVDSKTKRVPDFVFSTDNDFATNLLDTYFAGDGHYYNETRHVQASTSSEELAQGMFLLSRMVGLECSVAKYGNYYRLDMMGGDNARTVRQLLPSVIAKSGKTARPVEYRPAISHRIPVFAFASGGKLPTSLKQHIGGRLSSESRISDRVADQLGLLDEDSRKLLTGDIECLRVKKVEVIRYHGSYYNIETEREVIPNYMHGFGIFSHNCSTKVPYKTVGKEYIADRPEIEAEIKNGVREALRRLSVFLSRKGSMEASQRKMNIYGKYLPLIARFSTGLAGLKKEPRYTQLLKDEKEEAAEAVEADIGDAENPLTQGEKIIEQTTIEDYR